MNILVTGGTGFVGHNIAKYLIAQKHNVFVTGSSNENKIDCPIIGYNFHNIKWKELPQIDIVFHQAAITDTLEYNREKMFKVNFWYARKLIDQAIQNNVKKIIYASSAAVYGNTMPPFKEDYTDCLNVYAESKLLLDHYCKSIKAIPIIGLRYSNVYGDGEAHKPHTKSMIIQLYHQMLKGNPKLFKWGEQKRDFVYIKDVVMANMLAMEQNNSNVFNAGSGTAVSFNKIIEIINNKFQLNREIEYIQNNISNFYQNHTQLDLTHSVENLKYNPEYTIEKGIDDYLI